MIAHAKVEFRCKEHESRVNKCATCDYLVHAQQQISRMAAAYDRLFDQVASRADVRIIKVRAR